MRRHLERCATPRAILSGHHARLHPPRRERAPVIAFLPSLSGYPRCSPMPLILYRAISIVDHSICEYPRWRAGVRVWSIDPVSLSWRCLIRSERFVDDGSGRIVLRNRQYCNIVESHSHPRRPPYTIAYPVPVRFMVSADTSRRRDGVGNGWRADLSRRSTILVNRALEARRKKELPRRFRGNLGGSSKGKREGPRARSFLKFPRSLAVLLIRSSAVAN